MPKECPKCHQPKVSVPYLTGTGAGSRRWICRPCHSKGSFASRKKRQVEYNLQIMARRRSEPKFRAYEIWNGAKHRARQRGIEFNLDRADVERWLLAGRCQATGLTFDLALKSKRMGALSPSLDRIDPNIGYVPGNVRMVCWLFNRAKGDGTDEDVWLLVEALNAIGQQKAA